MAISINDRQLITQFITNTQNLNVNLPTNGGGCANGSADFPGWQAFF